MRGRANVGAGRRFRGRFARVGFSCGYNGLRAGAGRSGWKGRESGGVRLAEFQECPFVVKRIETGRHARAGRVD